ncbi:ribosome maturation factor RimM [Kosmotoga pacifica]|uniref:Ribosome maturation factor RimM n=1 Tax=Kosmotoga pacifica TaxID=1330330 RepID=A0A0G2ZE80_9BACT|nr:ribosome maturation factor RimM [Kosmotoga pacifica]AKI97118.1 ribosome maturation factor RimM [Kosmotoga pacifica]
MTSNIREIITSMVPVGRVVKPHGLRGEVKFKLTTNLNKILNVGDSVVLFEESSGKYVASKVMDFRKAGSGYILSLEGFNSIELAERVRGFHLYVSKKKLPPLKDDEYYYFQVLEAEVFSPEGEYIGKVADIIETGANDVLVVRRQLPDLTIFEALIPVIKDYVMELDLENGRIVALIPQYEKENE